MLVGCRRRKNYMKQIICDGNLSICMDLPAFLGQFLEDCSDHFYGYNDHKIIKDCNIQKRIE